MIVVVILALVISGIAEAINNALGFDYTQTVFRKYSSLFWDPAISWRNKYKNILNKTPAYFGAATFLVFTTDAWHLFKAISHWTLITGLVLQASVANGMLDLFLSTLLSYILQRIVFEVTLRVVRIS